MADNLNAMPVSIQLSSRSDMTTRVRTIVGINSALLYFLSLFLYISTHFSVTSKNNSKMNFPHQSPLMFTRDTKQYKHQLIINNKINRIYRPHTHYYQLQQSTKLQSMFGKIKQKYRNRNEICTNSLRCTIQLHHCSHNNNSFRYLTIKFNYIHSRMNVIGKGILIAQRNKKNTIIYTRTIDYKKPN